MKAQEKKQYYIDNELFTNVIYELSMESVKNTDETLQGFKELTLEVLDGIRDGNDKSTMKIVSEVVKKWRLESMSDMEKTIIDFCKNRKEIRKAYLGYEGSSKIAIFEFEDSTDEKVLSYIDEIFLLRESIPEMKDFFITDLCMSSVIYEMYHDISIIYKRG